MDQSQPAVGPAPRWERDSSLDFYEYYSLECKARTNGRYCARTFDLPGSSLLTEEEFENPACQPKWPRTEWKADIACPQCGCIKEYSSADVCRWHHDEPVQGDFFLHVAMECSRSNCHVPVEFYIVDFDEIASEEGKWFDFPHQREKWIDETDWLKLIRDGKFHGLCSKGHELLPIPKPRYRLSKRDGTLPSLHEMLAWGRVVS
jgi:hypothetical protein